MSRSGQGFNPVIAGLAAIAALFFILPLTGLVITGAVVLDDQDDHELDVAGRAVAHADRLARYHSARADLRRSAGLAAGPGAVPRQGPGPRPDHAADGASAGGRRHRAAARVRPPRPGRRAAVQRGRVLAAVHHAGRDRRRDVRRHAVPRDHAGIGPPLARTPAWRTPRAASAPVALDRVPARHAAADRAVAAGRSGAGLVAGARGVRRDDHVRRQLPRRHADRCRWRFTSARARAKSTRRSR